MASSASQAVVRCRDAADVSELISYASRTGLRAVIRAGGHGPLWRSSTGRIVIDVTPMHSVTFSAGVATVGAGARVGDV